MLRCFFLLFFALMLGPARAEKVLTQLQIPAGGRLSVVMTEGRIVRDAEPWCGAGRRLEGQFILRYKQPGQRAVETDLNRLMGAAPQATLVFPTHPWHLQIRDYTGKGRPEFTLGQYASCNGWRYRLFVLEADGSVKERPLDGGQTLFLASRDPSVILPLAEGGFEQRYFDSTKAGDVIRFYRWDEERQVFVLR